MSLNSEHDPLNEALGALREVYTEEPPARIQSFLTARLGMERRRKAIRLWRTVAALSAALLLVAWFAARPVEKRRDTAPIASAPQTQVTPPAPAPVTRPAEVGRVAVARRPERVARQKRQRPADPERENAALSAPFIAVPYTEPLAPSEQLDIYRVQLPRVTLSLYGLPSRTGELEAPVTADVAVGSDGVVRAVRFVR
jgi:hypothetical protein